MFRLTHIIVGTCLILTGLLFAETGFAQDNDLLTYQSGQTTFFAGQDYTLQWDRGENVWQSMDALVLRVVSANKIVLQQNLPARFPVVATLRYPGLRAGVVMDATITISAYFQQQPQKNVYSQQVFFFSKDQPFLTQHIAASDIGVIDKTPDKALAALLKYYDIPYVPVNTSSNQLAGLPHKWFFCAGLSFTSPQLFDTLYAALSNKHSVLIFPPVKGKFILPPFNEENRITLANQNLLSEIDKKLNLKTAGKPHIQNASYNITMIGDRPGISIDDKADGFGWLELTNNHEKMIFCSYNLLDTYKNNPAVMLLLTKLLDDTSDNQ